MEDNFLIIAGEKSGEEHALTFFDDLKNKVPEAKFWGVGGDILEARGVKLFYHLRDFSSWGISEVIFKIPFYIKALSRIENEVIRTNTKYAILIDFQDFNLRLAKRLKKRGVKVFYYVAPQAWVWKAYRAKVIENCVDTLFTIIPFEKKWFQDRGVSKVISINHPVYNHYRNFIPEKVTETIKKNEKIRIALLPGSRNFEVKELLPMFIKSISTLKSEGLEIETSIVCSPNVNKHYYESYLDKIDHIYDDSKLKDVLLNTDYAIASSGTVTLTCALFGVPTVVCYKSSLLNEFIFYSLLNYSGPVSLANIVHEKILFPELIQNYATDYNITMSIKKWLENGDSALRKELFSTRKLIMGESIEVADYISKAVNE